MRRFFHKIRFKKICFPFKIKRGNNVQKIITVRIIFRTFINGNQSRICPEFFYLIFCELKGICNDNRPVSFIRQFFDNLKILKARFFVFFYKAVTFFKAFIGRDIEKKGIFACGRKTAVKMTCSVPLCNRRHKDYRMLNKGRSKGMHNFFCSKRL